jgi:hypothetical protein
LRRAARGRCALARGRRAGTPPTRETKTKRVARL